MKKEIEQQKKEITDKENLIHEKNAQLKETEDQYEKRLQMLTAEYEAEQKKKNELDENLRNVKNELEEIE